MGACSSHSFAVITQLASGETRFDHTAPEMEGTNGALVPGIYEALKLNVSLEGAAELAKPPFDMNSAINATSNKFSPGPPRFDIASID